MMRRNVTLLGLAILLLSQLVIAQDQAKEKEKSKKIEFKPYGFIKGDMVYATAEVSSFGVVSLAAPQLATGGDQSALGFTAQHTRFGMKAVVGEEVKAGGVLEIDFFTNAFDANGKPRIRLAYATVAKGGFEARFGQQWDLFSPNNPTTNNTNGNMWNQGNRGFRRAQLQLSYARSMGSVKPMLQFSVGEAAREETGLGKDNRAGTPMMQGRLSTCIKEKYVVGFSFVNAAFLEKSGTVMAGDTLESDFNFAASGICFDFSLPLHKYFSLTGEVNTGKNLNNANLFSVSGNHGWVIKDSKVNEEDKNSMGVWINATSKLQDWLHLVVGYGLDKNTSDVYSLGATEKNNVLYGNICFPIKHGFSIALELQHITTTKVSGIDADRKVSERIDYQADVISLSGKIAF